MGRRALAATVFLVYCAVASAEDEIRQAQSFIVNGVNASSNRYPYFVSLRYKLNTSRNRTAVAQPYCGASLITDRLVLTAAHCAMPDDFISYYSYPRATTFKQLGFNFTTFPNSYVVSSSSLQLLAYIGARSRADIGTGNPIQMWFVHPWYDPDNLYYDIAIGLLTTPVPNVAKVKIYNPSGDIYDTLSKTTNITGIGMGDEINDNYGELLGAVNSSFVNVNNNTDRSLKEAVLGTLVPRVLCGKYVTAAQQQNSSDTQSGNTKFGTTATVVSPGQMCIGPESDKQIEARMWAEAYKIAGSANSLPASISSDLKTKGIDYTNTEEIKELLNGYNDTCQGDSGGPVFIKGATPSDDVQVGTVSYGVGCGSGIAGVYNNLQAYLSDALFSDFLLRVLQSVPNLSGQSNTAGLVSTVPGGVSSAG